MEYVVINNDNIEEYINGQKSVYIGDVQGRLYKASEDLDEIKLTLPDGSSLEVVQSNPFIVEVADGVSLNITSAPDEWIIKMVRFLNKYNGVLDKMADYITERDELKVERNSLQELVYELESKQCEPMDEILNECNSDSASYIKIIDILLQNDMEKHRLTMDAMGRIKSSN